MQELTDGILTAPHLKQRRCDRPDVCWLAIRFLFDHLRTHIRHRARGPSVYATTNITGKAHVTQHDPCDRVAVETQKEVWWFDVTCVRTQ